MSDIAKEILRSVVGLLEDDAYYVTCGEDYVIFTFSYID